MTTGAAGPCLSIVIPAYNEQEAIAGIIERSLAAQEVIRRRSPIAAVEIIVVNDGSSDRTAEIAGRFPGIRLITYEKNRGYGAAIKLGFAAATGELLGFLDADGTCDPLFFADLCNALIGERADVVIGSRLGPESEMPALRRVGNRVFASIINLWGSGSRVTDSASGMRVLRRSSLPQLYPLPDGMHFTPAMSSLAVFDPHLKILELPMRYQERTGESKLSVIRDGVRFLRIIAETALIYRPLRLFGSAGVLFLVAALAYGLQPSWFYLREGYIQEWMIYRLVAVAVGLVTGVNLLAVGVLSQQTVALLHEDYEPAKARRRILNRVLLKYLIPWGVIAALAGVALNARGILEYLRTGHVTTHWIYVITGGLLVTLGVEFVSFGVLARVLNILEFRRRFRGAGAGAPPA
jgi:glycosyltransferase involved in cell wall biosynthesis